jgi:hypothetical protein
MHDNLKKGKGDYLAKMQDVSKLDRLAYDRYLKEESTFEKMIRPGFRLVK